MADLKKELTDEPPVIRYTGVFSYDNLYKTVIQWFKIKGYDFFEKNYTHKGNELEFEWFGEKEVTEYYKYEIEISMFVWDFKDVEVIKNDEKTVLQKGRIQLVIRGYYILDYEKEWVGGFKEKLQKFYHNFIINKDIMFKIYVPLYKEVYEIYDKIRDSMGMERI